jgi:hypothetical protein
MSCWRLLPAESLVQLRAVYAEEPNFLLPSFEEERYGVPVRNADNLSGYGCFRYVTGIDKEDDGDEQVSLRKTAEVAEPGISMHRENG